MFFPPTNSQISIERMEIKFDRHDLAQIFLGASEDIRSNFKNNYGKELLTTTEQNAAELLGKIGEALYLAPSPND